MFRIPFCKDSANLETSECPKNLFATCHKLEFSLKPQSKRKIESEFPKLFWKEGKADGPKKKAPGGVRCLDSRILPPFGKPNSSQRFENSTEFRSLVLPKISTRCKSQDVGCALESLIGAKIKSEIDWLWSFLRKMVGKQSFRNIIPKT